MAEDKDEGVARSEAAPAQVREPPPDGAQPEAPRAPGPVSSRGRHGPGQPKGRRVEYPFAPGWYAVWSFFSPDGRLCYESFRFAMPLPKGGGKHAEYAETYDDLLPTGAPFVVLSTDEILL